MEWGLQNLTPANQYRKFGCPKCGAKHKFGHNRSLISCYRCWYEFCPDSEARKYPNELLSNLTPEERKQAEIDINSVPPWVAKRKAKKKANQEKVLQKKIDAYNELPWYKKLLTSRPN